MLVLVWGIRPFTREEGSGNIAIPVEWVLTENDCASINIHSHFEQSNGTRLLTRWQSDGIDAR